MLPSHFDHSQLLHFFFKIRFLSKTNEFFRKSGTQAVLFLLKTSLWFLFTCPFCPLKFSNHKFLLFPLVRSFRSLFIYSILNLINFRNTNKNKNVKVNCKTLNERTNLTNEWMDYNNNNKKEVF